MALVVGLRRPYFVFAILAAGACAPTAPAPEVVGPSPKEVPPPPSILDVTAQCGVDCVGSLPDFATARLGQRGSYVFLQVAESQCRLPDYNVTPDECSATCDATAGLHKVTVSFGALSPRMLTEICRAIVAHRGEPDAATCETIPAGGLKWSPTDERGELRFDGYLEYTCS